MREWAVGSHRYVMLHLSTPEKRDLPLGIAPVSRHDSIADSGTTEVTGRWGDSRGVTAEMSDERSWRERGRGEVDVRASLRSEQAASDSAQL